mmetsp:Transcript_22897/g.22183  ORF Transcript_22897/g.22183 Transcript_22897/m.22183 type:complete len:217 (-) Transcript_22897:45-695(-)
MLIYGGIAPTSFLACSSDAMLVFGEKYPYYMKYEAQIYRFVASIFLHADFLHVCTNIFLQLVVGSSLEMQMGLKNFGFFYILSGFGGVVFSTLFSDDHAVGASIAVFGMCGIYVSFIIMNYNEIKDNTMLICSIILFDLFLLLFLIIIGSSNKNIDGLGNFGGLLAGIPLGLSLLPPNPSHPKPKQDKFWKIGMIIFWASAGSFILLFYLLREPSI